MARNIFNTIQVRKPKSSTFDLSHDLKLGLKMGQLIPTLIQECIPGDKFNIRSEVMLRMAPMVAPVMHNVTVTTHYFFVPNRLVWPNWEKFITDNNGKGSVPAPPMMNTLTAGESGSGTLSDYLGLPIHASGIPAGQVSAIPFAAYQMVYNEYYRDQNLQTDLGKNGNSAIILDDGTQSATKNNNLRLIRRRSWEHDYFTASLPFAQKGDAVDVPITGDAQIYLNNTGGGNSSWQDNASRSVNVPVKEEEGKTINRLYADMDDVAGVTINNVNSLFK